MWVYHPLALSKADPVYLTSTLSSTIYQRTYLHSLSTQNKRVWSVRGPKTQPPSTTTQLYSSLDRSLRPSEYINHNNVRCKTPHNHIVRLHMMRRTAEVSMTLWCLTAWGMQYIPKQFSRHVASCRTRSRIPAAFHVVPPRPLLVSPDNHLSTINWIDTIELPLRLLNNFIYFCLCRMSDDHTF